MFRAPMRAIRIPTVSVQRGLGGLGMRPAIQGGTCALVPHADHQHPQVTHAHSLLTIDTSRYQITHAHSPIRKKIHTLELH